MPIAKPLREHRKPLNVSCTKQQLDLINKRYSDRLYSLADLNRSKYFIKILKKAIAYRLTSCIEESYTHGSTVTFQISCTPEELKLIKDYSDRYLPTKKRSRWIIYQITHLVADK